MDVKDFVAPKSHLHDVYITSSPMKEWHNIDSYVCKLLEDSPGLSANDCFAICCRSLSSLSNQVSNWPNSVSKYASVLLSKWKGSEKQHWLDLAKKAIQRKRDDEKITANNAEIQQKEIIQQQRTTVSAINLVTKEIDELASRGQETRTPENKICNKSIKESENNSPNHDEFDPSDTVDDNDDDSDYAYSSESSSCEETMVTKSARKLNSDEESIKEPGSNSPLYDEFMKEMNNTEEDYSDSDESVNDNNEDDPNDPDYVYSPSSSCEETKVTKSARKLNSDEETPSAKRTKLNEDTTSDTVSSLNESVNFDYGLRNYEEGIIIDSELALQETDEESVPASERLLNEDIWKKWKLKTGAVMADLLDKFARKKGHPLR
ncbi:hypothetical protein RhiirC2_858598 [Rhizophagus irregularis]|uniref:Uncharacterized protein n=1 Tax=Rhizophagus irregularis TaxID=588596 RepID=A0A2N1M4G3_9GLOM|nr:hypothetical protein RhiirC2_858598 [Rhizophagus irregularis]